AGLCDSLPAAGVLLAADVFAAAAALTGLGDFLATALAALAFALAGALAVVRTGFAAAGFVADVLLDCGRDFLEDFLRVFLDIRLPFVAFRGSIIGILRVSSRAVGF